MSCSSRITLRSSLMALLLASSVLGAARSAVAQTGPDGTFQIEHTDFARLFNLKNRVVQPSRTPWAGSFFPYGRQGLADESDQIPSHAARYDQVFGGGLGAAVSWEIQNHSCDGVEPALRDGCRGWWGHCNAWASAAIKEAEPRSEVRHTSGQVFTVGDQKAYLTEIWMESHALFAGSTNKEARTSSWIYDPQAPGYDAYWDVTPRAFFMILTHYLGLLDTSLVIDRFTGDEVWNQPLAGYRLLPIRPEDRLTPETRAGRTLYPVLIRIKVYWANDGVEASHVTSGFDMGSSNDDEQVDRHWPVAGEFDGRFLAFTLFFDAPLETNEEGTRVISAGRIMGEGIWQHQQYSSPTPDRTHPDFIWLPTRLLTGAGLANPHIEASTVHALLKGEGPTRPATPAAEPTRTTVRLEPGAFLVRRDPALVARRVRLALEREGVAASIRSTDVSWLADGSVRASILLSRPSDASRVPAILAEAGY
jgi:hypothetical protein